MVDVKEQAYSRNYIETNNGITGQRKYLTDWADKDDASLPSLGDAFPDFANCLAVSKKVDPYGATTGGGGTEKAMITFGYSTAQESTPTSTTVETMEIGGEAITAPTGKYAFTTGGKDVPEPPAELFPQVILVKSKSFSSSQLDDILNLVGKLNDASFESKAAGLWLFLGASARHEKTNTGADQWNYDYRFQFKEVDTGKGWNYIWNKYTPDWDTTDPLLFQSGDFSTLGL